MSRDFLCFVAIVIISSGMRSYLHAMEALGSLLYLERPAACLALAMTTAPLAARWLGSCGYSSGLTCLGHAV